ncbi:MAG: hypothetical protein WBV28_15700 [Terracidiphilus sp.]
MAAATSTPAAATQLDVVFDGTWLFVPSTDSTGKITNVDIYSPACGHPLGVYFTNQLNPNPWPVQSAFYQLDSHSYTLNIQRGTRPAAGMPLSGISTAVNHCVAQPRPIASNWDMLASISVGPDAWVSADTFAPQTTDSHGNAVSCFNGKDAPAGQVSSLQTLSFTGVTAVSLLGAPGNVQGLLPAPWNGQGTLIFEDEIPYVPTLQHERTAIFALANLAGLDLALDYPLPKRMPVAPAPGGPPRPQLHTGGGCGAGIIMMR